MGPQNVIMGDEDFGMNMPQTQTEDDGFAEMQKTAKFSKTREFEELKKYLESRMDFYRTYLPNGDPVIAEKDPTKLGQNWLSANVIIGEFKAILSVYEGAALAVKDEATKRKRT